MVRSVSPHMHNAAFRELGLDWVYVSFPVEPGRTVEAIRGLAASGVAGLNVTMPHKTEAVGSVDRVAPEVEAVGALNTIVCTRGLVEAHNTDPEGFRRYVESDLGVKLSGADALVLGTGGAARAVVWALAQAGAASITVAGRPEDPGPWLDRIAGKRSSFSQLPVDPSVVSSAGLVVNATPVGQLGEPALIDPALCTEEAVVIDLVYGTRETPLLAAARQAGLRAHSGLGMLIHQAALSFELWTSQPPPIAVMSAAAVAALGVGP